MIKLGVNIDHVATLRQARYRLDPNSPNIEPSPLEAALAAERGGADGITAHLRLDRRHIQDSDITALKNGITTKLNLEMGVTTEILAIALEILPADVCLVPEARQEVTTEGGLDVANGGHNLHETIRRLQRAGIRVSLFVDPDPPQIAAAAALGVEFVELHTGAFANSREPKREYDRLARAAVMAHEGGLSVNAGHGLNYTNIRGLLSLPHLTEVNIGHAIVSRAVFVGMENAVREMKALTSAR
jgi:pyridoxine 5-phosphate synthase